MTFKTWTTCALLMMGFFQSAHAKSTSGIFMVVKGDVQVVRSNNEKIKAKVSMSVSAGDTILSGNDARAKIQMEDRNLIMISPNTELKIETYVNNGNQKNVELNLKEGKVRSNVNNVYDGESQKFIIKTPTAVAGVRGTHFVMSFNKLTQETQVVTFKGRVEMTNIPLKNDIPKTTVVIQKGETSTASGTQPLAPPKVLPQEQLRELDKETQTLPQDRKSTGDASPPSPSAGTEGQAAPRKEVRVEDPQDQTPKTFERAPVGPIPAPTITPPSFQPPPPPINNLPGDAIRQQNEKTRVKIIPQNATGR